MKKLFILSFCLMFLITGCSTKQSEVKEVVINLPTDNTINGYREQDDFIPDIIPEDQVSISHKETITVSYCGNKKSKVFHKLSCSSIGKTKEENKVYFATKEEFSKNGYTPCKICNP